MARVSGVFVLASAVLAGMATVANASEGMKKPNPRYVHFVDEEALVSHGGTQGVLGRMDFDALGDQLRVHYHAMDGQKASPTKIVVVCRETQVRLEFPIGRDYSGALPTCSSSDHLHFSAE